MNFGPQNCGAVPRTSADNHRRGPRWRPQIGAAAPWRRNVWINTGFSGSFSILRRSRATWTSTIRLHDPSSRLPSRLRLSTGSGIFTKLTSKSNSAVVSGTSSPEGDKVAARTSWTGTQDGLFLGRPATGKKVQFATSDFYRIEKGKVVEHWDIVDSLPRAIALGLVPAPGPN